jgi:hypothetical protein
MAEELSLKQRFLVWLEQHRQLSQEPKGPEYTLSLEEQLAFLGHRVDALTKAPVEHALEQLEQYLHGQSYATRNDNVTMHNVWMDINEFAETQRWQYETAIATERQAQDLKQNKRMGY